eukprot:scaffold3437_cov113-Cylindrotheca_fusiformis.AAC.17
MKDPEVEESTAQEEHKREKQKQTDKFVVDAYPTNVVQAESDPCDDINLPKRARAIQETGEGGNDSRMRGSARSGP